MFEKNLFHGKRILVTGGGTGLGRVMTEHYAALGADVVICGRRPGPLAEVAAEVTAKGGGRVTGLPCDIRDPEAVERLVNDAWQEGPLTGLVNNAAGNFISRTQDLSPRGFQAIANIVFFGTFYVTHAVGKRWIAEGRKGSVLSILVTWVWTGSPFVVPSAMSKAGVAVMTQSLAVEWAPHGIRLNAIAPGAFPTEGASARLNPGGLRPNLADVNPMGRAGEPDELGRLATFLMADGVDYLTGQIIAIDGGQWMTGGGTFSALKALDGDAWQAIRESIRASTARDKSERG